MVDLRDESKVCSFCGRRGSQQNRMAGGLGAMICFACVDYFHDMAHDPAKHRDAARPVWNDMSDAELLSRLPLIIQSTEQSTDFVNDWVGIIRTRNVSWAQIGAVLGVSRQAAWERFAGAHKREASAETS
ncbi:ClpX C4-type zinc finger protein [Nocardioides sp.]|uniref:ClpX C4-type zinc finger protein n=1 Tax=Nocardioides sp. TaxID=35761 RepID=UPI002617745C|nr:ClpX C4-type zinc finger protein [Nocardioides sp.]